MTKAADIERMIETANRALGKIDALATREQLSNEDASVKLLGDKQPSQTFASPEQLGALTVYLCSDAACNMRGVGLPVDGGWLAQ